MKRLTQIGVGSVFKMSAALGAVAGLIVGVILLVVDIIDKRFLEGVVTFVLAPLLYGIIGAAVNALMAWIYNAVASRFGGVELHLED